MSAAGYSKKPTGSMVARLHSSCDLFPADICTIICPQDSLQEDVLCVMGPSFMGKRNDRHAEWVVWVPRSCTCDVSASIYRQRHQGMLAMVLRIPKLLGPSLGARPRIYKKWTKGVFSDITPFLVSHFMLYPEAFNQPKALKDTQSACWCYIVALVLDGNYWKISVSAQMPILFASHLRINQVLSGFIDYRVKGVTRYRQGCRKWFQWWVSV